MRPANAPESAIPIPPPGNAVSDAQATQINGIRRAVDDLNRVATSNWEDAKRNWLAAASHDRELGITIHSKPVQPYGSDVIIGADTDFSSGIIWIWLEPILLGSPCPDLPPATPSTPSVSLMPVAITDMMNVPEGDIMPVGHVEIAPDGSKWQKVQSKTLFGTSTFYKRIATVATLLLMLLISSAARLSAQVTVACSPEPPEVVAALKMKAVLPWGCFLRNDAPTPRTLNPEDVYIGVIQARPVDPASALIVLSDHQSHSTAGTILKAITIGGQVAGIVTGFTKTLPTGWSTGMAVGSGAIPAVTSFIQGQVPSIAPYAANLLQSPVVLAPAGGPGATATKLIFCARQKAPQPLTVLIP